MKRRRKKCWWVEIYATVLPGYKPGNSSGLLYFLTFSIQATNNSLWHTRKSLAHLCSCLFLLGLPQFRSHCVSHKLLCKNICWFHCTWAHPQVSTPLLSALQWLHIVLRVKNKVLMPSFPRALYFVYVFSFVFLLFCPVVNRTMCWWSVLISYFQTPHLIHPYILLAPPSKRMQNVIFFNNTCWVNELWKHKSSTNMDSLKGSMIHGGDINHG